MTLPHGFGTASSSKSQSKSTENVPRTKLWHRNVSQNCESFFTLLFIWQTWKFNSEYHKSRPRSKWWPGVTQSVYFLQGFTFCHPCPTWLPDTRYFQWNIFVCSCYTTHSSMYLCFYKILLALKPNILLTSKVCTFNPAKTALSHSFSTAFIHNWLQLLPSLICLKCQFVGHSPLSVHVII